MKDYFLRKLSKINFQVILISSLFLVYILFEVTNIEYSLNRAFTKLLQYVIVPIFAFGALIAIKDSTKNILQNFKYN